MTRPKLPLCGDTIRPRLDARHSDPGWTITEQEPWMTDALCAQVDPESFFPDQGASARDAKAICARCPVRAECLAYALERDERFGVWGGQSEKERRRLKGWRLGDPLPPVRHYSGRCDDCARTYADLDLHLAGSAHHGEASV